MTRMYRYMHTYMVTCCDIYCKVINLHVHVLVCIALTLFKRINYDTLRNIFLCSIKFYTCAHSSLQYNLLFYVIIIVIVNYLGSIHLLLMIQLF